MAQGGKKMKLYENGAYLIHGKDVVINGPEAAAEVAGKTGKQVTPEDAKKEKSLTESCRITILPVIWISCRSNLIS